MMHRNAIILVLFCSALLLLSYQPAGAVWHSVLLEHFSDDPPDWPWDEWEINPDLTWSGG